VRQLLLALALAATTTAARAADVQGAATERTAWELDLFAGYGQLAFPTDQLSSFAWYNGGPAISVTVAYRGEHFTHPFVDISYVPILSSGQYVNIIDSTGPHSIYATNSSYAIGLAVGPGFDIDWFRVRAGVGIYDIFVKTDASGVPSTVTQLGVGFMASLSALVWRPDPFALGIEARMVGLSMPTSGIYQSMWSAGITGRWDFARSK
jgi:hypothetical protein